MPLPPRPTLRCLRADLQRDWGSIAHQRAIADLQHCPPLSELDHPVIRHAVETFGQDDAEAAREGISGLTNPMWWKLKTGRWRGAVYVDSDGQAWVCAAGLRRGGEASDFYKSFTTSLERSGPEAFLPGPEDYARLRREDAEFRLKVWESDLHETAAVSLEQADHTGQSQFSVPTVRDAATSIATVVVQVEHLAEDEEDEGLGEIVLTICPTDWTQVDLLQRAEIIVLAAVCPDEESWVAGHTGTERIFSITGLSDEIHAIVAEAALGGRSPGATIPGPHRHWAHRERLTQNYVNGEATKALCGVYFVPRRDPESLETCPACEAVYRALGNAEPAT